MAAKTASKAPTKAAAARTPAPATTKAMAPATKKKGGKKGC